MHLKVWGGGIPHCRSVNTVGPKAKRELLLALAFLLSLKKPKTVIQGHRIPPAWQWTMSLKSHFSLRPPPPPHSWKRPSCWSQPCIKPLALMVPRVLRSNCLNVKAGYRRLILPNTKHNLSPRVLHFCPSPQAVTSQPTILVTRSHTDYILVNWAPGQCFNSVNPYPRTDIVRA